jgi:hypothetical protein
VQGADTPSFAHFEQDDFAWRATNILPMYKTAMDLTVYLEQVVRNFSRYHKYRGN